MGAFTGRDLTARKSGVEHQGKIPRRERRDGYGRGCGLLWHDGCWFKAVMRKVEELWRFKVDSGIVGQPITYLGPTASNMSRFFGRGRMGGCGGFA